MENFTLTERSYQEITTAIKAEAEIIREILNKCLEHNTLFIDQDVQYRLRSRMIALSDEIVAANMWMQKRGVDPKKVFKR